MLFKDFFAKKHNTSLTSHEIVADYFVNLAERDVKKIGGFILDDNGKKIKQKHRHPALFSIDGIPAFKKAMHKYIVNEMVSSMLYNDIGVFTPKVASMINENVSGAFLLSQDVKELKKQGVITEIALQTGVNKAFNNIPNEAYMWSPLYDDNLKETFLEFMTDECLEELTTMFLLDELRTDADRHRCNFFLYKKKGSPKYEGVIPIDLEWNVAWASYKENYDWFKDFISHNYISNSFMQNTLPSISFSNRINNIKNLIHDGKLTPSQIEKLKKALEFDMSKAITDLETTLFKCDGTVLPNLKGKDLHTHTGKLKHYFDKTYEVNSKLWEYNREQLGRELEL